MAKIVNSTIITLNFDEKSLKATHHYTAFILEYPRLQKFIDEKIGELVAWCKTKHILTNKPDFYIDQSDSIPCTGDFGVDDDNKRNGFIYDWDDAIKSMGTTNQKMILFG